MIWRKAILFVVSVVVAAGFAGTANAGVQHDEIGLNANDNVIILSVEARKSDEGPG